MFAAILCRFVLWLSKGTWAFIVKMFSVGLCDFPLLSLTMMGIAVLSARVCSDEIRTVGRAEAAGWRFSVHCCPPWQGLCSSVYVVVSIPAPRCRT